MALSAPVFDQDQIQTGVVEAEFSMQDHGENNKSVVEGNQQKDTPATNQPIVQQPQVNGRCGRLSFFNFIYIKMWSDPW